MSHFSWSSRSEKLQLLLRLQDDKQSLPGGAAETFSLSPRALFMCVQEGGGTDKEEDEDEDKLQLTWRRGSLVLPHWRKR